MSTNQYSYPPPPPPPQQHAGVPAGYPQYQQHQYGVNQPPRGGGRGRGRGNHNQGGRGDFHALSPYNHHAAGYNGPAPVDGGGGGGYVQQNTAPYIGPQPPQISPNGYLGPQWHEQQQQQQHHPPPPHHHQQQLLHQPPAPIPLSAQNYHPNYAPQVYNQPQQQQPPPQYGPQQPFQHSPPPSSYAQHIPASQSQHHPSGPPQPQQWRGPPHQVQPPFNGGGRGRGRGNSPSRGGFEAPLMGPPIRMGFGDDRSVEPMSQASNGYPPTYANAHNSPPLPYSQPAYQGYPSQNFSSRGRPPLDPNPFYSQGPNRGRGGFQHRGKRDSMSGDKMRHRNMNKSRHSNGSSFQGSVTDLPQKPAAEDGNKLSEGKKKKKKKRKTNTLGLTPHTEEYEDSDEEDDADEESRLAAAVEDKETPKLPSDLTTWLAERRQRWPTKARREAKEAELAKRRAQAAEQSARDKSKAKKEREEREALEAAKTKKENGISESKLEKQQRKAEKLRKQLERAEKKLQEAMQAGTKRKRDDADDGDEEGEVASRNGATVDGDLVDQVIAKATAGAKDGDDDSDSGSSSSSEYTTDDDSGDDSEPEAHTLRLTAPVRVLPSKKPILQRQCKYFSTGGTCGKKGKCRFVHDQAVRDAALREKEMNGGRMTLAQRLMQNDKEKDDLMVLKSIKYLYERGLLNEPHTASASYSDREDENMQPRAKRESYDHTEPFTATSEPDINENMMYGED